MTYEQFIAELKVFCTERGFEIAGTCSAESIYGEITVRAIGQSSTWIDWNDNKFNFKETP